MLFKRNWGFRETSCSMCLGIRLYKLWCSDYRNIFEDLVVGSPKSLVFPLFQILHKNVRLVFSISNFAYFWDVKRGSVLSPHVIFIWLWSLVISFLVEVNLITNQLFYFNWKPECFISVQKFYNVKAMWCIVGKVIC